MIYTKKARVDELFKPPHLCLYRSQTHPLGLPPQSFTIKRHNQVQICFPKQHLLYAAEKIPDSSDWSCSFQPDQSTVWHSSTFATVNYFVNQALVSCSQNTLQRIQFLRRISTCKTRELHKDLMTPTWKTFDKSSDYFITKSTNLHCVEASQSDMNWWFSHSACEILCGTGIMWSMNGLWLVFWD